MTYRILAVDDDRDLLRIKSLLRRAAVMPAAVGTTSLLLGVVGTAHGVGSTTLATNMAARLAATGKETILVDMQALAGFLDLRAVHLPSKSVVLPCVWHRSAAGGRRLPASLQKPQIGQAGMQHRA